MGQKIKTFKDGSFLEYDRGSFDDWCVYLTQASGKREPPRDMDYFAELQELAHKYGVNRIYGDYVSIYDVTRKQIEPEVLQLITDIASNYEDDVQIDIVFSILYMAMISEERKKNSRLGKRIKRLGLHVLLIENKSVSDAANFMRGMGWRDIDSLCRQRGF